MSSNNSERAQNQPVTDDSVLQSLLEVETHLSLALEHISNDDDLWSAYKKVVCLINERNGTARVVSRQAGELAAIVERRGA